MLLAVGPFTKPREGVAGEQPFETTVRYRTVGDMTCTAAVESAAKTPAEIIVETSVTKVSERGATRADDRFSDAAMEDRKREGYF
jgi:sulfate adenylyltransferase subunit 2